MQVKSWSALKDPGDWVIEDRIDIRGQSLGLTLCVMEQQEEQIKLPDDLAALLRNTPGVVVASSTGWE